MSFNIGEISPISTIRQVFSQIPTTLIFWVQAGDGNNININDSLVIYPFGANPTTGMVGKVTNLNGDQITLDITPANRLGSSYSIVQTGYQIALGVQPSTARTIIQNDISKYVRAATIIIAASNSQDTTNADYICTGTNDQTTINTAIAAISSSGGKILLLDGTFNLGASLNTLPSNSILEGQGNASILYITNNANINGVKITNITNVLVRNIQINGNRTNQSGGISYSVNSGIHISGCDNIRVENCYIQNTYMQGIYAENSTNLAFIDNRVHNTGDGGIFLHPASNNTACANVLIENNIVDMSGYYGITAIWSSEVIITGNNTYNNGQTDPSQGFGIDLEGSSYCTIIGNNAHDGHGGIVCRNTNEGAGYNRCTYVTITGNTCYNNTPSGSNGECSIQIDDSDYIEISGNNCSYSNQGINIGNATEVIISGNISTNHINSGIRSYTSSGASGHRIIGNYVASNTNNGMSISVPYTFVSNNTIRGNTYEGINMNSGSSNSVITGNYIYDNTDNGIEIAGSSCANVLIQNNFFNNTGTAQGRSLYESSGGGPTIMIANYIINQSNQPYYFNNSTSIYVDQNTEYKALISKNSNYTINPESDYTIIASGSGTTITLPDATLIQGRIFIIKRNDPSHSISINTTSSQTIDGVTSLALSSNYEGLRVQSDSSNWQVIGQIATSIL